MWFLKTFDEQRGFASKTKFQYSRLYWSPTFIAKHFANNQFIIIQTYFDQILKLLFECCGTGEGFQCSDLHAISTTHTTSVWRVFLQWKMSALALKEDMVLLGVVIQHSWHAHNRLWHNVKSSQPNVRGSHFQQIESWVQLEKVKLWLITVCEYRWRGWSGIVGSSQSSHQFGFKWNFFFFLSKLFFFTSCPRQWRNVSPHAGEYVILLCHSKLRLSFPLECLHWKNIMALVSTPQPLIRLIMASFSPDKCQSTFFFFWFTINKMPLFKQEGISAELWIPRSLCHNANVTPQLNLNPVLLGRAGRLILMGGASL